MSAFTQIRSTLAALPDENIDTDQIIPARFLTTTTREGLGQFAFNDWRRDGEGNPKPFVLTEQFPGAQILLAGRNFGCGSSREHAPWALLDFGLRVVISSQIADIFRNNALKNGLLAIVLAPADIARLQALVGQAISVDLEAQQIALPDGATIDFHVDGFARECLLRGVDQLGYLLTEHDAISRFESARAAA